MEPLTDPLEALQAAAVAHHRAGRYAQALRLYRQALAVSPADADLLFLAGSAAHRLGQADDAARWLEAAVMARPDFAAALNNLGRLLFSAGRYREAEDRLRAAVAADDTFAPAWRNLGDVLKAQGALDAALTACRRAVAIEPTDAEGLNNLGMALRAKGEAAAAESALRQALALQPDYAVARYNLCVLLLETDRAGQVGDLCADAWLGGPMAGGLLACRATAAAETGDTATRDRLMDLDVLVHAVRLGSPPGHADRAAYDAVLARHVAHHPSLRFEPEDQSTRHGSVTRDLLIGGAGPLALLEAEVRDTARRYVDAVTRHFGASGHPVLALRPSRARLTAWGVVMTRGGHQAAHIHPAGWLSLVYYPRLPAALGDGANPATQGWIEFGRPPEAFRCRARHPTRLVRPEEGMLIVFPSYLYHRTIPYESDDARISIAFDLGPEG